MSNSDMGVLLAGVARAAGVAGQSAVILSVTDASMVELEQNMLRSLDAVPSRIQRIVVGISKGVCARFQEAERTTCIEIFADVASTGGAERGSADFQKVVMRKHVVLTTALASGLLSGPLIYSDPDVVFLEAPDKRLRAHAEGYDILFTADQFLQKDATGCADLAAEYKTRGVDTLTIGKNGFHPDINTGLFYVEKPSGVADTMLFALIALKDQEKQPERTQQFALMSAIKESKSLKVGVAPGDIFVNGNVFWGHRTVIDTSRVASVHANWMAFASKRACFEAAGLWIGHDVASFSWSDRGDSGKLDDRGAMVLSCWASPGSLWMVKRRLAHSS